MKSNLRAHLLSGLRNIRTSDDSTIGALGYVATSSKVHDGFRLAAAQSLRAIHTSSTLPFLGALLDSTDPRIRHEALAGFSMFVENLPIQRQELEPTKAWLKPVGQAKYRSEATDRYSAKFGEPEGKQEEYVAFWRTWWSTMKPQINRDKSGDSVVVH